MRLVPAPEEQKWLTRNLRKLIAKNGFERFVSAPIVEPTRRFFPEVWNGTVRDVHVVTQRLMHMAALGDLRVHMTMYGRSEYGHAVGWFNGFEGDRCNFGVEISQMRDPEAAAGVMAHEVAHAWRHWRELMAPSTEKEELLTDVTTVYLGFGILTANNTDRYRTSGTWSETRWSNSAVGYLPPDAMSFLLAVQASARNRRDEIRAIEKHLEPNQQACFEEAMHVLADVDVLTELALPAPETWPERRALDPIEIDAPEEKELVAPPQPIFAPDRNENEIAYAKRRGDRIVEMAISLIPGVFLGVIAAALFDAKPETGMELMFGGAAVAALFAFFRPRGLLCSLCESKLVAAAGRCPGCAAAIRGIASEADLRRAREEQLDKLAAAEIAFEECPDCKPEIPCPRHVLADEAPADDVSAA